MHVGRMDDGARWELCAVTVGYACWNEEIRSTFMIYDQS